MTGHTRKSWHARRLTGDFVSLTPGFRMSATRQDETTVIAEPVADTILARASTGIDKSDQRVRRMFGSIAVRYDFLNHLFSLNIDRSWRTFTTRIVAPVAGVPVLDCCTGTADLALAYDHAGRGRSPIVGTDFCREMLVLGHAKARKAGALGRVTLVEGDTQRLPVPSNTFGVVSVAFGLRNVRDTVRGVDEMIRACRPGGKVAILEFSRPRGRFWDRFTSRFFATCFLAWVRPWHPIRTVPMTICPGASSSFPTARPCSSFWLAWIDRVASSFP